ncbi:hypothetical protein CAG99_21630 [Streptomyces marincola]|uniref:OmpR/PhoB-type domain-containing protein n=2 Tax=Streptomyces marincola TaxID=2878388 RepID=A0A1W7D2C0_9ACTN|nr:hypothetical protein CAG99_21630 [Streptomyces marincola]
MRFRMLGPLEVTISHRPVDLGGFKQRAALGYLLLHLNQVVPTSRLLGAMWSGRDTPTTARKILQNAIWSLRRTLSPPEGADAAVPLLTQAPGYVIKADPAHVDLYTFHDQVKKGQDHLSAGAPAAAAGLLRDALALWRGPVLADLAEAGVNWPELTTLQNARLDAMEDYFEAELQCGRHAAILGDLEAMVEAHPLRERTCGKLMRALYRCGRQAEALRVYDRARSALVEDLGLEPSHELRDLQRAILTHAPGLLADPPAVRGPAARSAAPAAPARAEEPRARPVRAARRRRVSVLLVCSQLGQAFDDAAAEVVDEVIEDTTALVREQLERLGGTVAAQMGAVILGLFGGHGEGDEPDESAERAVRCAMALRDCLTGGPGPLARGLAVRSAVVTGEAVVRPPAEEGGAYSVNGALVDDCQFLLPQVPVGGILTCDRTREATRHAIAYREIRGTPVRWLVDGVPAGDGGAPPVPEAALQRELGLLHGLFLRTVHRSLPHLVTVLSGVDADRTRLLTQFRRMVTEGDGPGGDAVRCLPCVRVEPGDDEHALRRAILRAYCDPSGAEPPGAARRRFEESLERLVGSAAERDWLRAALRSSLNEANAAPSPDRAREVDTAWRRFLELAAAHRPLVVAVDGLHQAGGSLLAAVENLAESFAELPLFVVVGARPDLLVRRPDWAGGKQHATTITLSAPSGPPGAAMTRLLGSLDRATPSR